MEPSLASSRCDPLRPNIGTSLESGDRASPGSGNDGGATTAHEAAPLPTGTCKWIRLDGCGFHVRDTSGEFAAVATDVCSLAAIHRPTEAWFFGAPRADWIAAQPSHL